MIFLLDTTTVSEMMRRNPIVTSNLSNIDIEDRVVLSVITFGEIQFGINRVPSGKRKTAMKLEFLHLLAHIPCLGLPPEAGILYGDLKRIVFHDSLGLGENDLWIASHGLALNARVVTSDEDYSRLPDLDVIDWKKSRVR